MEGREGAQGAPPIPVAAWGTCTGCRLAASEAEELLARIVENGAVSASGPSEADLVIVGTCAVTARALSGSRKLVASLRRSTDARIIVTGCAARYSPGSFEGVDGLVLAPRPGDVLDAAGVENGEEGFFRCETRPSCWRSRALLKVQDGCDNRCGYCMVPLARGGSRSLDPAQAVESFDRLATSGFREVVLTGIDLASWGGDLPGAPCLADLVEALADRGARIRLGSLEPMGLSRGLVARLARAGVCPHLHLPLQSASDRVLKAMGRRFTRARAIELIEWLLESFDSPAIGMDIMTGFPGEDEAAFEETVGFLEKVPLAYLHVFPFSPRPGTAAWGAAPGASGRKLSDRVRILSGLSVRKRTEYRESLLGKVSEVLVEQRQRSGRRLGLTERYVPVAVPEECAPGSVVRVELTRENMAWDIR